MNGWSPRFIADTEANGVLTSGRGVLEPAQDDNPVQLALFYFLDADEMAALGIGGAQ